MNWYVLAFLAPLFWSLANYVDKFVISKYLKGQSGVGSLVIFTGLTGFVVSFGIILLGHNPFLVSGVQILLIMSAGGILVYSFVPYLKALQFEDSSVVVPLYQLIPVISYFLALIFLEETLTGKQLLAGILVIFGAVLISINLEHKYKLNFKVLGWMFLASLGVSVNSLMFKYFALENSDRWATAFWEYIGAGVFSVCLWLFIGSYRQQFNSLIKQNGILIAGLNIGGEVLNLGAKLLMGFATLSAPIALVAVINGIQPAIIFIIGLILTLWIPHVIEEKITKGFIIQRVVSIVIMFVGIYFLIV